MSKVGAILLIIAVALTPGVSRAALILIDLGGASITGTPAGSMSAGIDFNEDGFDEFTFTSSQTPGTIPGMIGGVPVDIPGDTFRVIAGNGPLGGNFVTQGTPGNNPIERGTIIGPGGRNDFAPSNILFDAFQLIAPPIFFDDSGNWATAQDGFIRGFLGLQFTIDGNTHFGWVDLAISGSGADGSDQPNTLTLFRAGYQDIPNTPLPAGIIPLPPSILLLVSGFVAVVFMRRRRDLAATP